MKKLLLTLVAVLIGMSAQAIDYYLIGGFNGWTEKDSRCKFTAGSNGVYTLDLPESLPLTSGFKINDGTWTNNQANFGAGGALTIGQTYNLNLSGTSGNIEFVDKTTTVMKAHLEFNPTAKTLVVTGGAEQASTIYGIHGDIFGVSSWSTENMTESNGNWVLSNKTIEKGNFGIKAMNSLTNAQTDWISADGNNVVVLDQAMKCKSEGTNFSIAAGTYTFTFNPTAMTLTVTGTQTGETPDPNVPDYSTWWVNIGGPFNGNNFYDGGVQPVDGIATFSNLAIGNQGFKVKIYDGADKYYIADGVSQIPVGEWVQYAPDGYDITNTISGAVAGDKFDVKVDVVNLKVMVTKVGGGDVEPTYPEQLYLLGAAGKGWNPTVGLEFNNEGDGIFTLENVKLNEGTFAVVTNLAENDDDGGWNYVNSNRYGPQEEPANIVLDQEYGLYKKGDTAWTITEAGWYTVTVDFSENVLVVEEGEEGEEPATTFYLVGECNEWGDGDMTAYTFTDNKDGSYTLTLPALNGNFKVYDGNWSSINLGAEGFNNEAIENMPAVIGNNVLYQGSSVNLYANNYKTVTLTLNYSAEAASLEIEATAEGNYKGWWFNYGYGSGDNWTTETGVEGEIDDPVIKSVEIEWYDGLMFWVYVYDPVSGADIKYYADNIVVDSDEWTPLTALSASKEKASVKARIDSNGNMTATGATAGETYILYWNFSKNAIKVLSTEANGVESVETVEAGETVYFNLQGQKVANPERGIFVKVQNGKATKVVK